jgi:redox-sensitive bicupin YhaK (pirin superfamily)
MQLMCAGRGIVHSEMPGRVLSRGLQLWINLRAKDKMMEPRYFEISAKDIPRAEKDSVSVKGIC